MLRVSVCSLRSNNTFLTDALGLQIRRAHRAVKTRTVAHMIRPDEIRNVSFSLPCRWSTENFALGTVFLSVECFSQSETFAKPELTRQKRASLRFPRGLIWVACDDYARIRGLAGMDGNASLCHPLSGKDFVMQLLGFREENLIDHLEDFSEL